MRNRWVVRVVTYSNLELARIIPQMDSVWLEQLRYAWIVKIHRQDDTGQCFDLLPPRGVISKVWAEQTAKSMESFGFNAVAAPRWEDSSEQEQRRIMEKQCGLKKRSLQRGWNGEARD